MKKDTIKERTARQFVMKQVFSQKELHEREAHCTRQDPPQCMAACPIHMDVRGVCAAAARGDLDKALALLRETTPFVCLLAKACDAPCEAACVLSTRGGGVAMRALERACLLYGSASGKARFLPPKKSKNAAVCGDDLAALACAYELGRKGYDVTLYTTAARMDAPLAAYGLSEEEIQADMLAFTQCRIAHQQTPLDAAQLGEIVAAHNAVCLSGPQQAAMAGENVFGIGAAPSPVQTLRLAKDAALAADRFLQGAIASPAAEATHSRLYVSLEGVEPSVPLTEREAPTRDMAVAEAGRCIQCQCTACMDGCVYLQHYKRDPRRVIREIYNNLSIVMGDHMANIMINSCALCGQCTALCPNGFATDEVCELARETMVQTGKMPPSAHAFAIQDLEFSNGEAFLSRPQPGTATSRYLFFPGCQAAAVSPETVEKTYRDLMARLPGGVGLMLGCCGAIAKWAGREALFENCMELIREGWEAQGKPEIIVACPTCAKMLREAALPVRGIWDVLLAIGLPQADYPLAALTIQDACGARGEADTQNAVRQLLGNMHITVEEPRYTRDTVPCCGYGGLVGYANRDLGADMARFCAAQGDKPFVTYCMACRDRLLRAGADAQHLLELVYGVTPGKPCDITQRRYNRILLKEKLQRELWEENVAEKGPGFTLYMDEAVRREMDERMILQSDVEAVMAGVRAGASVVRDPAGERIARARVGDVTFWVRFGEVADGYRIYSAYSHRMTIEVM